ncbi:MAG TPA: hypothetical protein VGN17_15545 [Bryobacteraceae bacterium]|jgi:hypothetical protein
MGNPSRRLQKVMRASALILLTFLVSCSSSAQAVKEATLPSGKKIKILGFGQMHFTNGSAPGLMVKYRTDLKVTDLVALKQEVDEIWPIFKVNVEQAGLTVGIVSANEIPQGNSFISTNAAYTFVFRKQPDGSWKPEDPPAK